MALSAGDLTKIRSPHHTWSGDRLLTVNAVPLTIVATAQINQSSFTYPLAQLTVDNTSADWLTEAQIGRMVMIGTAPGLGDVTYGVIRKTTTSNTLYIDPKYPGEPGYPRDIQQALANDHYISVIKFRPAWGLMSSIRKGVFYKNWDETYSDGGKNPRPMINLGEHQQADVIPSNGLARFTIDVDPYYWAGRSYSSHTWNADGQTVILSSPSQLVVDCEPGCWEISYSATDTKGKTTVAYRYLFANDDSVFPPLNASYDLVLDGVQDRLGCAFTLVINGSVSDDTLFPGQMFLFTMRPRWGNPATGVYYGPDDLDDPNGVADNFVAYLTEGSLGTGRGLRETSLTLEGPVRMARYVAIEKQIVIESTSPANWAEATSLLSNPVGLFYYLSALHAPYLINGHDFHFDSALLALRRKIYNLDSDVTLGGQLAQLARALDGEGNIGSDASGATWMLRHPAYMNNADRNALATQWPWIADDIEGELQKPLRFRPQVGKTFAGAFAHDGSSESLAFRSLAPGYVRSQAGGEITMDDTTVTALSGQTRVNEIAGFHHVRQNMKSAAFEYDVKGLMDVAEPCRLDLWHTFTVGANYDPLGEGWTSARILPLQVRRRWEGPGGRRMGLSVEVEPESFGFPGITLPTNPGAGGTWVTSKIPPDFDPYSPKAPDLNLDLAVMSAWNEYLLYGRSFNFGEPLTAWRFVTGLVIDATLNWHSAYFSDPADPLEALILTYNDDLGRIFLYSIDDLLATSPTITEVESWQDLNLADNFYFHGRILVSRSEADFWIVAWKNNHGVIMDRSSDAGSSWTGPGYIGDGSNEDENALGQPLAIDVNGQQVLVAAKDGTTIDSAGNYTHFVYRAVTKTGSFTKIANPTGWQVHQSSLVLRDAGVALVPMYKLAALEPDNPLDIVDLDGSYADYSVGGGLSGSGTGTFLGFSSQVNIAYGATTKGTGLSVFCNVEVDLTAPYRFTEVTFWRAFSIGWTLNGPTSRHTVTVLDENDAVIASRTYEEDDQNEAEFTVTAADLGLDSDAQVYKVTVDVQLTWISDGAGSGTTYSLIDDIDIAATLIEYDSERAMFSLVPSTGTYTQRGSLQRLPFNTYGIAVDSQDPTQINMIGRDEKGDNPLLLLSTDGGASWSAVRSVKGLVGLKRGGDIVILFGYNRLEASADGGETSYNMLGDWASRVGPVGRIRGIAGVL